MNTQINQCDGCSVGLPVDENNHHYHKNGLAVIPCTKDDCLSEDERAMGEHAYPGSNVSLPAEKKKRLTVRDLYKVTAALIEEGYGDNLVIVNDTSIVLISHYLQAIEKPKMIEMLGTGYEVAKCFQLVTESR